VNAGSAHAVSNLGSVVVDAELSELDYLAAWRSSPTYRRMRAYLSFFPGFTFALFLLQTWRVPLAPGESAATRLIITLFTLVLVIVQMRGTRRGWIDHVNRGLGHGNVQIRFDALRLELVSELVHYRVLWTELAAHVEARDSILLFVKGSALQLLIPKQPFLAQQWRALRVQLPGPPAPPQFWMLKLWLVLAGIFVVWYVRHT
jgi:hypothetical protein